MRVLHISKITGIAGSEGHLLRLLPGLAHDGHNVELVILEDANFPLDSYSAAMQQNNISVYRIPIRSHVDFRTLNWLKIHLQQVKPDIVHTHLLHGDLYGLIAAWQAGIPTAISTRHNDDKFRRNLLIRMINKIIMSLADKVIAISEALALFISEIEGISANKIVTIHYGLEAPPEATHNTVRDISRAELRYGPEEKIIGIFGRLVEQKGVDILLNAFSLIHKAYPEARLLIVGDGRDRDKLAVQANQLRLHDVARFTGWVDNAQRLMPACDIIAVPSRWEGFGLVTLEAMGWALPIVASRASSLPEIIRDEETGLLVPPEDTSALAEALMRLLQNPDYARKLGWAGYQRLLNDFSVERMVCATLNLYRELTERE